MHTPRQSVAGILLAFLMLLAALPAGARYIQPPPPGTVPPSLEALQKAQAVVVVTLTDEVIQQEEVQNVIRQAPLREQAYAGALVKGNVIGVLKGKWGKTVSLAAGATTISANTGESLLLCIRGGAVEPWLADFCYLAPGRADGIVPVFDGEERLREKDVEVEVPAVLPPPVPRSAEQANVAPLDTLIVYRVKLAMRLLEAPTREAAQKLLEAERAKTPQEKLGIVDDLAAQLGKIPDPLPTDPGALLKRVLDRKGQNCWEEINRLVQMIDKVPSDDVRKLIAAMKSEPQGMDILSPLIIARADKDPAFLRETARDATLPAALRISLYARVMGMKPSSTSSMGMNFQADPTLKPDPEVARKEVIDFLTPMLADARSNEYMRRYLNDSALQVLVAMKWEGAEEKLIAAFPNYLESWSIAEQFVRLMGPYEKAIDTAIAYVEKNPNGEYGKLLGVVRGLAWSDNQRAIAFVRKLAETQQPVLKWSPLSIVRELDAVYGPGYAGSSDSPERRANGIYEGLFSGKGELMGSPAQGYNLLRYLLEHSNQARKDKLWELYLQEANKTQRGQLLGEFFRSSPDPWVREKMKALWEERKGEPYDSAAFSSIMMSLGITKPEGIDFALQVLLDAKRPPQTRSYAVQMLRGVPKDEKIVTAVYQAMKTASFSDPMMMKLGELPKGYTPTLACEVYMLPEMFVEYCGQWGDKRAIPWILELTKAGKLQSIAVMQTLAQLDPELQNREIFALIVAQACRDIDPQKGNEWHIQLARQQLDGVFNQLFLPGHSNEEEAAAWLKAFDSNKLDRTAGRHWARELGKLREPMLSDKGAGAEEPRAREK